VDPERLRPVADWLSPYEAYWRGTLWNLRDHLDRNPESWPAGWERSPPSSARPRSRCAWAASTSRSLT